MTTETTSVFCTVEEAVAEIAAGRMIIVTDDEDRENEGDLIAAASGISSEAVNFMALHGRGLICTPILEARAEQLGLPAMVSRNTESFGTNFTVSVDAAHGITTGISAQDRALTIRILADPTATASMLVQPGHIFPLQAKRGGVLRRAGHTEAAIDLARLARKEPAAVICEILNEDGTMARLTELKEFAEKHGLKILTIESLIEYRQTRERLVELAGEEEIETDFGPFTLKIYNSLLDDRHHLALVCGDISSDRPTLVRVHREDLLDDLVAGTESGRNQYRLALKKIAEAGEGVLVYMRRDTSDQSIRQHLMGAGGGKAPPMDLRDYGIGAQIIHDVGVRDLRLITNASRKIVGLEGHGLRFVDQVPLG